MEEMFQEIELVTTFSWCGRVTVKEALNYGFTGAMLRGSGLSWD